MMDIINLLTDKEIMLLNKAQIDYKSYSKKDVNLMISNITEYIMSHSLKGNKFVKLQNEYSELLRKLDKVV